MDSACLNCHQDIIDKFCSNCGQKASVHRYSVKHFVEHDLIHGIWHVDKGLLFTIKELFTRPGHSVREYLQGKRVNYFNFISLIMILLAVSSFLSHYTQIKVNDLMPESVRADMNSFERFSTKYPKLVLVILIPVYSIFSFIWFRKTKLNFTEHIVLNAYKTVAELVVGLLFSILTIFYVNINGLIFIYYFFVAFGTFLYSIWFYYQFFSGYGYTKKALVFRSVMVPLSYIILSMIIGIIVGILKHVK
jgi:hypothetical protein